MLKDPRIDKYLESLPNWQKAMFECLREMIHEAEPEIVETIKRTSWPFFTLEGNVCAVLAAKDHVNVFIYDPTVSDPDHLINQGHENKTAKAIQFYQGDKVDKSAFKNLIREVAAHNRAGGWRKLQK